MLTAQIDRKPERQVALTALCLVLAVVLMLAACTVAPRDDGVSPPVEPPPAAANLNVAEVTERAQYPSGTGTWDSLGVACDAQLQYRWMPDENSPGHPVSWTVLKDFSGTYQDAGSVTGTVPFMAFPGDQVGLRLYLRQQDSDPVLSREVTYTVPSLPPLQTYAMSAPGDNGVLSFNPSNYWFNMTNNPLPDASDFDGMVTAMSMHNIGDHHYGLTTDAFATLLDQVRGGGNRLVWLQYMMYHGVLTNGYLDPAGSINARLYAAECGPQGAETYPMIAKDAGGNPVDGCPSFCQEWETNPLATGFVDSLITVYAEEHVRGGLARFPWVGVLVDYLDAYWADWRCGGGDCADVVDLDQDGIVFSADGDEQNALIEANRAMLTRLRAVMDQVRGDETFIIICNGDMARNGGAASLMDGELIERMDLYGCPERTWSGLKKVVLDMPGEFTNSRLPYGMVYMGYDDNEALRHVLAIIGQGTRGRLCNPNDSDSNGRPNVCPDDGNVQLGEVLEVTIDEGTKTITATCEYGWAAIRWTGFYPWAYIAVATGRAEPDTLLRGSGWPRQP